MVSRSFFPLSVPGAPQEVHLADWGNPPPNANMLAFGNLGVQGGSLNVQGWLYDTKNPQSPQVLGKQYREEANDDNARLIAHRFADEIIFRLGGGIQGIAETKLYFVSSRSGSKEIWQMDYDGANQKQLTHLGSIALSPHVSPDGSRVAFSGVTKDGWQILMYSLDLDRLVSFPQFRRRQLFAGMVVGRTEHRVLVVAHRQHRDLHRQLVRRQSSPPDREQGPRCFADLEPED